MLRLGISVVALFTGCARTGETDGAHTSGLSSPSAAIAATHVQASHAPDVASPAIAGPSGVAVSPGVAVSSSAAPSNTVDVSPSVAALLARAPKPKDVVTFSARVLKIHACPPCTPDAKCKPCEAWLILGDSEGATPAESVVLLGNPTLPDVALHAPHTFTARWRCAPSENVTLTTPAGVQPLAAELGYIAPAP